MLTTPSVRVAGGLRSEGEWASSMVTALGSHSPRLHAVRALLDRRGRREQHRFSFEGPTLLAEALSAGIEVGEVYATREAFEALPPAVARSVRSPVYLIEERALRKISHLTTPSGIVATARTSFGDPETLLATGAPALLLAGISDPGNAGTLLRCAEVFGIDIVLFDEGAVDAYNPKVVRAAMGSIFRQRLGVINPRRLLSMAHRLHYAVVAADRRGVPMPRFTFPERSIIAVGHERHGVTGSLPQWDAAVAIPQQGSADSLNAAIAGCIILYERARRGIALSSGLSTRRKA